VLEVAADPRLSGIDFEQLRGRALAQYDEVEARRLEIVRPTSPTGLPKILLSAACARQRRVSVV
jgi:hypothetical protein